MRILRESIDQIYNTIDIVEVVSDFVKLKKRGANYMALSPFVSERTPSFSVSPSKQIFKCFSSGKGGDAVKFLMELEKMTYVEALKYLAKKYNIELKYDQTQTDEQKEQASEKDAMYIAMEFAKNYYKDILFNNEIGKAIGYSYFIERGLDVETIQAFELGFALDSWDDFFKTATKAQFNKEILEKCGLIKTNEKGKVFDFIRNRVVFPIHSAAGKVIAFAGRILNNDKGQPKYINSPETILYTKNEVLYGLYQAKNEIRNKDNCFLVEGYMDVISLFQAGIKNVVASSGTSLTENQIKLITRYTEHVTILYDGDKAGIKAAMRGIDMLLEHGLKVRILLFPDGEDPDSYVNKVGAENFIKYVDKHAQDFIHFKANILLKDSENDPINKSESIKEIVNSISKIKDSVQRAIYFKTCSQLLEIDEQVIISEYNKIVIAQRKKSNSDTIQHEVLEQIASSENEHSIELSEPTDVDELSEKEFLRILIEYGDFAEEDQPYLYQQIFEAIENIEFKNHAVAKVFSLYQELLAAGTLPTLDYFTNNPDKEIENLFMEILTQNEKYELSPNWVEKYSIFSPNKDENKIDLLNKSRARLHFEKCRFQFKENQKLLKEIGSSQTELEAELLYKQIFIKNLQKEYAKLLGLVVSG